MVFSRAVERAARLDADWLVVTQDDKYIWTTELAQAVADLDSRKPQVVACSFGCGQGWIHNKKSNHGALEPPLGWIEPPEICEEVFTQGGLCGGVPFLVSR